MKYLEFEETIISSSNLNDWQQDAIVSCIGLSECQHQSTVKLIWGPPAPGTGKTKMVGLLLFSPLKLKCRTLTSGHNRHLTLLKKSIFGVDDMLFVLSTSQKELMAQARAWILLNLPDSTMPVIFLFPFLFFSFMPFYVFFQNKFLM